MTKWILGFMFLMSAAAGADLPTAAGPALNQCAAALLSPAKGQDQCESDWDCLPDEHCVLGQCLEGQGCTTDGQCGPNSKCIGGVCN